MNNEKLVEYKSKVDALMMRHKEATDRRNMLMGQRAEKEAELRRLTQEISDAGYDPKNLKADCLRAENELKELMASFDRDLTQTEAALKEYE
jgi:septal ring factor EnvC (AmiA/AmiB activator)